MKLENAKAAIIADETLIDDFSQSAIDAAIAIIDTMIVTGDKFIIALTNAYRKSEGTLDRNAVDSIMQWAMAA